MIAYFAFCALIVWIGLIGMLQALATDHMALFLVSLCVFCAAVVALFFPPR